MSIRRTWRAFRADESGSTALEYALIVALIFLTIIGAVTLFANGAVGKFEYISNAVASVS